MGAWLRKRRAALVGITLSSVLVSAPVWAELQDLSEDEMSDVNGAGIGLVLENFLFTHGTDATPSTPGEIPRIFKIGGIRSTPNAQGETQEVDIVVSQLYIARAGSNYGQDLAPVNLGRLINPYSIDVIDGNTLDEYGRAIGPKDKAVVEIAAPKKYQVPNNWGDVEGNWVTKDRDGDGADDVMYHADGRASTELRKFAAHAEGFDCVTGAAGMGTCASRPASADFENGERPDIGMKLHVQVGDNQADSLSIHAKSAVFDGSRLRLWGDDNRLVGEFKLNLYSPEVSITACMDGTDSCQKAINLHNFELELALGNSLQPLAIDVISASDVQANPVDLAGKEGYLRLGIKSIREAAIDAGFASVGSSSNIAKALGWNGDAPTDPDAVQFFKDYYQNPEFRSNLYIGNLEFTDPGGSRDFGSSSIQGMLIQYLDITTHDLAR